MRLLFMCYSHMQLLSALKIKMDLYSEVEADLIISDHANGLERTVDSIDREGIFERIIFCDTRYYLYEQSKLEDLVDVFRIAIGGGRKYKKYLFSVNNYYDKIFYCNLDPLVYSAFDMSIRQGHLPECIRIDESVCGYRLMVQDKIVMPKRIIFAQIIRSLLGKKDVFMETRTAYCFSPELFPENSQIKAEAIPSLDRNDANTLELLQHIYSYESGEDFPEKMLFFGSSADVDGYSIHESDFIINLTKRISSGNLRLKTHPRDRRDLFYKAGINVMESTNVPWEVLQFTTDYSKHIFVTIGSSSLINAASMFEDGVEAYMLYPLLKDKDEKYFKLMESLIRPTLNNLKIIGKCRNIRIIENEEEWEDILNKHFGDSG